MSPFDVAVLVLAGFGAGLIGSVGGLASLVSYPTLLAVGLSPVAANITNTVALVGGGAGSALGSRPELRGQGGRLWRLGIVGILGGLTGGALLLVTPPGVFERIVPWLIGLAGLTIIIRPRPRIRMAGGSGQDRPGNVDSPVVPVGIFLIGIYGGYFGAAAGVLTLALLLSASDDTLARSNAVKNVVLALANGVAAVLFVVLTTVEWAAVVPLAIGCLAGGRLGPVVVRRAPARPLRILIGLAGLGLAVKLGLDAYR